MTARVWSLDGWSLIEGPVSGSSDVVAQIDEVRGWYGSPVPRSGTQARPRGHGRFRSPSWRDGREIEIVGYLVARSQVQLEDAMLRFAAICSDNAGLHQLSVSDGASGVLTAEVELGDEVDVQPSGNWHADYTLTLYAPDPLRYGPAQTASTGLPTAGGGLVYPLTYGLDYGAAGYRGQIILTNPGTAPAPIQFTVTGGLPAGFEVSAAGQRLTYPVAVPAGQTLHGDTATGTLLAEGTADRRTNLTNADWMQVPARGSLTLQFTSLGGTYDPAAELTATVRPASW